MENKANFFKIIDELCEEKNISQKKLSFGWIRELKKEDKVRNIIRYTFDLNTAAFYNIACDKYATYEVLSNNNINTIPHMMVFNPRTRSNYANEEIYNSIYEFFDNYNQKIVIKANDSSQGKDVFFCNKKDEIRKIINDLFCGDCNSVSICPYLDIEYEYRTIFLDGKIEYIYKKRKPFVTGNGIDTIEALINQKKDKNVNYSFYDNLNLQYIPNYGEIVEISWKHNLSAGAVPIIIDENDEFIKEVRNIAERVGNVMNAKFASIDISQTKDKKILVMEVNASVCMNKFSEIVENGYEISKKIYSKAIDKMFE